MNEKLKVCMLGATGVGKTSLVARYVSSIFTERYATTIGVKIETHRVRRGDRSIDLIVWDLSGEDEFQTVQLAYLRGAAGYLLVVDGTRRETLGTAASLHARSREAVGDAPFVVVLNKADLVASWDIDGRDAEALDSGAILPERSAVVRTSAKTGAGVQEAFGLLVDAILGGRPSDHRSEGGRWI
jgi:small GTP-binding protein